MSLNKPPVGPPTLDRGAVWRRERLHTAIAELAAEHTYRATTVAAVADRAGIPRRWFYSAYESKEACLLAALDSFVHQVTARLISTYRGALASGISDSQALATTFDALVDIVCARRSLGWLYLVEAEGAGPAAMKHCESALRLYGEMLADLLPAPRDDGALATKAHEALAGGILHVLRHGILLNPATKPDEIGGALADWLGRYASRWDSLATAHGADCLRRAHIDIDTINIAAPGDCAEEFVTLGSQRSSDLTRATFDVVYSHGYHSASTAAIAKQAGISPRTFYRSFANKESAVLEAARAWLESATAHSRRCYETAGSPALSVVRAVRSLVTSIDREPACAHVAMVDVVAVGAEGHRLQASLVQFLIDVLTPAFAIPPSQEIALRATAGAVAHSMRSYAMRPHQDLQQPDPTAELLCLALIPLATGDERPDGAAQ